MFKTCKRGLEGALEEALARGMQLKPRHVDDLDNMLEASLRDVEALHFPTAKSRLKVGRPCKASGPRQSRMKGVRLDVAFLVQVELRLMEENRTFSGLVQDLLGEWMAKAPAASPGRPARS